MQLDKLYPEIKQDDNIKKIVYYPKTKQLFIHLKNKNLKIFHDVDYNDNIFNLYRHYNNFKVKK